MALDLQFYNSPALSERIAILESLCKQYRRTNSIRINAKQMGRKVDDERPDLEILKNHNLWNKNQHRNKLIRKKYLR